MTKLTPADYKFIDKFNLNKLNSDDTYFRTNYFTGEKFEVDYICAAAIDFVFALEPLIQGRCEDEMKRINKDLKPSNAVMNFDRARYLVMKLNPKAYMGILD
jgi:hypothetical protein